jgi:hypothetical protein
MQKYTKYNWEDKNQLTEDIKKELNISQFLKHNGLSPSSGNFRTFKKWVILHQIDFDNLPFKKFDSNNLLQKKLTSRTKLALSEIFCISVENGKKEIKKIILKENLLPYICSGCGNQGIWNGKPLNLQLEHKNGNNIDNRLENLEFLCPNCHTQTDTYGSKNTQRKIFNSRIKDLIEMKNIYEMDIKILSEKWGRSISNTKFWINKYTKEIQLHNVNVLINKGNPLKNVDLIEPILENVQKSNGTIEELKQIAIDFNVQYQYLRKIVKKYNLSLYMSLEQSKSNVKKEKKLNLLTLNLNKEKQVIESQKVIQSKVVEVEFNKSRTQDAIALTNKKELPILAKKWGISVNATKKWIRNNLPEHFDTIFDDTLLVKNQKKQHKENYYQAIAQLKHDSFNLDEFMGQYNIKAKASAYALIKAHNPGLYEKLMPDVICIYCTGKTRTAGQSGGQTRYRCLDCDKSFTSLPLQIE